MTTITRKLIAVVDSLMLSKSARKICNAVAATSGFCVATFMRRVSTVRFVSGTCDLQFRQWLESSRYFALRRFALAVP